MWPLKKNKPLSDIPNMEKQSWAVSKGEYNGEPLLVRHNEIAAKWKGHKELGIKLGFAIPLNYPNENGFPTPDENEDIWHIEDLIESEVFSATPGILAMILTTGTMKEFVFYIPDGVDIASIHSNLREKVTTHTVQCMATREPNWSSFTALVKG